MKIATALLSLGCMIDFGIAIMLVATAGFVFEGNYGPNIARVMAWSAAVFAAIALPLAAFLLRRKNLVLALGLAWLPLAAAALITLAGPAAFFR